MQLADDEEEPGCPWIPKTFCPQPRSAGRRFVLIYEDRLAWAAAVRAVIAEDPELAKTTSNAPWLTRFPAWQVAGRYYKPPDIHPDDWVRYGGGRPLPPYVPWGKARRIPDAGPANDYWGSPRFPGH